MDAQVCNCMDNALSLFCVPPPNATALGLLSFPFLYMYLTAGKEDTHPLSRLQQHQLSKSMFYTHSKLYLYLWHPSSYLWSNKIKNAVKPLNKEHIWDRSFGPCREVVLYWEAFSSRQKKRKQTKKNITEKYICWIN